MLSDFYGMIQKNILHLKEAYLLVDLLNDINYLGAEYGMPSPVLNKTCELKTLIGAKFGDGINFYPSGRNCIVHNSQVNRLLCTMQFRPDG